MAEQPAEDKRFVILPDLPLDVYEMPDADTHALIAECPTAVQAKQVLTALNQSAVVEALLSVAKGVKDWHAGEDDSAITRAAIDAIRERGRAALAQVAALKEANDE